MLSRLYMLFARPPEALRRFEQPWILGTRAAIGIFFCISGGMKLFVGGRLEGLVETLTESGIPFPELNAPVVASIEFVCGGLLALGLLTPVCAVMLAGTMVVAVITNSLHSIQADSALAWVDEFLYLPEVLYVLILVWIILRGPSPFSLDASITRRLRAGRDDS